MYKKIITIIALFILLGAIAWGIGGIIAKSKLPVRPSRLGMEARY